MARITLIALPTPFLELPMNPPLGLAYIGAVLKRAGHDVKAIDFSVLDYDYDKSDYLNEIVPGNYIYGISSKLWAALES